MAKRKGVSSKTHTAKQLDDYANQNNPNNKAYKSRMTNEKQQRNNKVVNTFADLDWMCFSKGMYEFD